MRRIGYAASKIAKDNLLLYNLCVVFISFLFSLLIFIIAGSSILLGLIFVCYVVTGILPSFFGQDWLVIIKICMITLTSVVSVVNLLAILKNIKLTNKDF